jgi:hypothetical protein
MVVFLLLVGRVGVAQGPAAAAELGKLERVVAVHVDVPAHTLELIFDVFAAKLPCWNAGRRIS